MSTYSSDDDSEDDSFGAQSPPLTEQIASILRRYPDGGQILKELIQNADDAGATEVRFLVDSRQHPTDGLPNEHFKKYQGPALYAWNDATFKREDWDCLAKIERSEKEKEVLKVGRFGLGFLSVFHVTDLPMIVSRKWVGIVDPHRQCVSARDETRPAGEKKKLGEFLKHEGHMACFDGIFGMSSAKTDYNATLFRFPLRQDDTNSKICQTTYSPAKVNENLFTSLKKEAPIILLFLKNITSISLHKWDSAASQPTFLFRIEVDGKSKQVIQTEREKCKLIAESYCPSSTQAKLQLFTTTFLQTLPEEQPKEVHWLVLNAIGSDNKALKKLGMELRVLPWVGIAACLSNHVPLPGDGSYSFSASAITEPNTLYCELKPILQKLHRSKITLPLSHEDTGSISGQAFCFLPLPGCTALPVNIHGYFSVADNRRSIKWPAHDDKGKEAQWNRLLLRSLVAPAYAILLACRGSLLRYEGALPTQNTRHITDPYAAWPVHGEVKNQTIWSELVEPTLKLASEFPLLWTQADGGKWVKLSEAFFLPGSFQTSTRTTPPALAIEVLIQACVPVVSFPNALCETLQSYQTLKKLVLDHEVTPHLVREALQQHKQLLSSISDQNSLYALLDYILSDDGHITFNDNGLAGIPLLPLMSKETPFCAFETSQQANPRYVFTSNFRDTLHFLPGIDAITVSTDVPPSLEAKLVRIAQRGKLQLQLAKLENICSSILKQSIFSWCKQQEHIFVWKWTPGCHSHPPFRWISSVWNWLYSKSVDLSLLEGLPLIPQSLPHDCVHTGLTVSLIEVTKALHLITLHNLPSQIEPAMFRGILEQLGFIVVERSICFVHPKMEGYVPTLKPDLVARQIYTHKMKYISVIHHFNSEQKHALRRYLSLDSISVKYYPCLKSLPIFKAGIGKSECKLVCLDPYKHILPPPDSALALPTEIHYPDYVLCREDHYSVKLIKALGIPELSVDSFCINHLIPFAQTCCSLQPSRSVGDKVVMWLLSKQPFLSKAVTSCLKRSKIIRTFSNVLKSPTELYDPHSQTLQELFDSRTEPVFPAEQYNPYLMNLRELGLKTWKSVIWNIEEFCSCIHSRVCTVGTLLKHDENAALRRSNTILRILLQHPQEKLWDVVHHVPFLFPQTTPPPMYPPNLQWYAQPPLCLEATEGMCLPVHKNEFLIGSVKPFLSCQYNSPVISGNLAGRFCQMKPELVIQQLSVLVKAVEAKQVVDTLSISHMVSCIYSYLHGIPFAERSLPETWIWWENECKFLSATSVVLKQPGGMDLEPYIFAISKNKHLSHFKDLFKCCNIKRMIKPEDVIQILVKIQATCESTLSDSELRMVLDILSWLYNEKYESHCNILIPTSDRHLLSPTQCTFDDRGWIKQKKDLSQFKFVHERVDAALAKYFEVKPLSAMIAPSEKLRLNYTLAGQHERVTQRIRHIVQDYETNIDIFKELIQNADDAGATEVKFLIDWRKHPSSSLLAKELKPWQGPALLAYNNATFSDQDFQHICQVAGETKRSNPLKTGRFGVGFCAAYQLTDLPSFISRRYFTVFDPHTTYLGDRVSHREPGMRIDLIENQGDLKFYEDQFVPYQNIFGCNVFTLPMEGYNGTLFRFPFRNEQTAQSSEISRKIHTKREYERFERALQSCATELLLFLKHVERVSVFHLNEQDCNPGEMKKVLYIHKTTLQGEDAAQCPDQSTRTGLIEQYLSNSKHQGTKKSFFQINIHRSSQECSSSQWLLCSTLQDSSSTASRLDGKKIGLVPFAEVAVSTDMVTGASLYIPKCVEGHIFCFLPLPIRSELMFHVNGFFDIGKDRRSLSATDDETFGSQWNKALGQDALTQAFTQLLALLASRANLQEIKDPKFKEEFLKSYYSLWNFKKADGLVPKALVASFKKYIMDTELKILWSEANGGSWICSKKAILFPYSFKSEIYQDAISMMIQEGYKIVEPPFHVMEMIKRCLHEKRPQAVYTYQRFCEEVLFPKVTTVDPSLREKHLLYLLEKVGEERDDYKWAEQLLRKSNCIPCQGSSQLLPPDQLINSTQAHLRCLYSPDEGRFPIEFLLKSSKAMNGLRILGMATFVLKISDLLERAMSVCKLTLLDATKRSHHILDYFERVYCSHPSYLYVEKTQVKETLWDIPFLLPATKPEDINIPWCTKPGYITPSETFHLEYQNLVFTQKPVVELPCTLKNANLVLDFLGVSQNIPTLELVIQQLQCLVSTFTRRGVNDATNAYLEKEKVMCTIYQYLDITASKSDGQAVDVIKQKLKALHFIWQDGHFLSVDQVVLLWRHQFHPYLCELSSANKRFEKLFSVLGVQEQPSVHKLAGILKKIRDDHDPEIPVSEGIIHFIEDIVKVLESQLNLGKECNEEIFLPDEDRVMRPASQLATQKIDCAGWLGESETYRAHFETGSGHFVYDGIPPRSAKALGARPILDAILNDIEDESFLDGSDYGQHEDLCDRLNSILKKYPADESIFQEFIQNADDAQASEVAFVLDHRRKFQDKRLFGLGEKWTKLQHTPALCIFNNQKFSEADIKGIAKLGRGGKDQSVDKIGKFGIGFNVAYHITDCPAFVSYGEGGEPENFCVFDPTCEFAPKASRKFSPGRRWKVTRKFIDEFADQFEPFLANDLLKLSKCGPNCLRNFARNGFVVFRLPLTRTPETTYTSQPSKVFQRKNKLGSMVFTTDSLSQLLKKLSSKAEDILIFLNHVHQISVFEITEDGMCIHNSTTTATVPALHIQTYKQFPSYSSEYLQQIMEGKLPDTKSTFHQVNIFHVEGHCGEFGEFSTMRKTAWLVQRAIGSKLLKLDLLQCALQKGLKPIGGVAVQLSLEGRQYHIFCFLPLPLDSHLPVHINGHFLVDDSRKHLEMIKHEGLSEWNKVLATCVIAPAYVELVLKAKRFLPKIDNYYDHLFPHKELSGELGNLTLVEVFYKELLSRNPRVLMPQPFAHSNPRKQWFHLKSAYFCTRFECKQTKMMVSVSSDLINVLTALDMPITKAPNWLYRCCSLVDDTFKQSARIEPQKVIGHLQQVELSDSNTLLIKENIKCLLMYCCKAYTPNDFRSVLPSVPLLLAANGSLKMASQIYESRYMSLLPEFEDKFIDPGLEHSPAGELLLQFGVIVPLPVAIVAQCIKLRNTNIPIPLHSPAESIVKYLWKYLVAECSSTKLPGCIQQHFQHKPIIPTCDQRLFPVQLCKAVVSTNFDQEVRSVMEKLGCPLLDANFQEEMQVLETVTTSSSCPENVIQCLLLQPTLNCEAELDAEEVHAFIECVRKAKSIKKSKVALTLSRLRIFQTTDGSFVSLNSEFSILIMPTGIPLDGMTDIQRHTNSVVLKCPSEYAQTFYNAVVPNYSKAVVGAPDFYERLVLPNLVQLDDKAIFEHLLFIHNNLDQPEFQHLLEVLSTIPFIFLNGKHCMPSELYDSTVDFFKEFYPNELPPTPWNSPKWLNFLNLLGLKTKIADSMWLSQAQKLAKTISEPSVSLKTIKQRSQILLSALMGKIRVTCSEEQTAESIHPFITFLQNASEVRFICTAIPVHIKQVLVKIVPHMQKQQSQCASFTCFKDSVFSTDSDLAGLCKSVLPEECNEICSMPAVIRKDGLCIEFPLSTETVVQNLCLLSEAVSTSYIQLQSSSVSIKEVKEIFIAHYACLNRKKVGPPALMPLQEKAFVLQNPNDSSLPIILVKKSQLAMSIPSTCHLKPFCYQVPQNLLMFNRFLTALGIPDLWDAARYAQVLSSMNTELKSCGQELSGNDQYMKVAESAYNELIRCLRHGDSSLSTRQTSLILLTDEKELQDSRDLFYDDVPWYAKRLPAHAHTAFKFIRQPLPDNKGRTIPPSSLGVRLLSAVVSENIHEDVKSSDFKCIEEELYALKKRTAHCPYKQKLLDTLTSSELFNGLCRMYWSENKTLPTQEFLEAIGRLPQLEIRCIAHVPLKTVLCQSGKSISGTEYCGYFCHLEVQGDKECLYISPHIPNFSEDKFLKQLAFVVRRMLQGEIKNDTHIMAMFQCEPHGIPHTLDIERVEPYNPSSARGIVYHVVGDDVPLDELTPHDSLIILNFSAGELVLFHSADGTLKYCEIVEVKHSPKVFEQSVQIRTQQVITSSDGANTKEEVKWVSPLQLYKRLTPLQHVALFSKSTVTGIFATPVTLAEVPVSDLVTLCTWLREIYQSAEVQTFSGLDISLISIRLIGHLHYQLVLESRKRQLFTAAVMEIQRLICCIELPSLKVDEHHQLQEKFEMLTAKFEQVSLDGEEIVEEEGEEKEQEREDDGERREEEGEREEEEVTTSSSTSIADGNTDQLPSIYTIAQQAPSSKLQNISGTPSSPAQPVTHPIVAHVAHPLPQRFPTVPTRRGYRPPQPTRFQPVYQAPTQPPKPPICIKSAKIWLEQAKIDFRAAEFLLTSMGELNSMKLQDQDEASGTNQPDGASNTEYADETSGTAAEAFNTKQPEKTSNTEKPDESSSTQQQEETSSTGHQDDTSSTEQEDFDDKQSDGACHFPALVCFLCHETAEKCLKGVHYAFCGLRPDMIDSSHLVELLESLKRSPHSPLPLIPAFQDCVNLINEHENKSRLPNYQIPPCAPAAVYSHLDASEAFSATRKLLIELLKNEKLRCLLGSIGEIPKPKFISTLKSLAGTEGTGYPETWDHMDEGTECILMPLDAEVESEEYGRIAGRFLQTMPNAYILKIERIQNKPLWMKYIHCSQHMLQFNDDILGEQMLFHGSRTTDPKDIYNGDSSFDMRFSSNGMWGKGNYFAVNASYSNSYAYHTKEGAQKMLVAWVLTGYSYCSGSHSYTKPPLRCDGGNGGIQRRYDSVSGVTGGSKVYITYENNRAYPAYLVTYMCS